MKKIFKYFTMIMLVLLSVGVVGCSSNEKKGYNYYMENYKYLNDKNHVFQSINYSELLGMISDDDEAYIIYLGGSWCPNCQCAVPFINDAAKKVGIKTVYNFDTRLDNKSKELDIRKCNDEKQTLMWETIVKALGYTSEEYVKVNDEFVLGSDGKQIPNLHVPTAFAIKNGKVLGYVTREYIYEDMTDEEKTSFAQELEELFKSIK